MCVVLSHSLLQFLEFHQLHSSIQQHLEAGSLPRLLETSQQNLRSPDHGMPSRHALEGQRFVSKYLST